MQSNLLKWAKCIGSAVGGLFLAGVACCVVLYVYAFASMVPPDITGWHHWTLILQGMLLTPSLILVLFAAFTFGVGVVIVVGSVKAALGMESHDGRTIVIIAILLALVLVLGTGLALST